MRLLLVIFTLLFSLCVNATVIGNCPLMVATKCFNQTDLDRFNTAALTAGSGFIAVGGTATSLRFSPLKVNNVAVQVAASTNIICHAMRAVGSNANNGAQLVYGDDAITEDDTAITNVVYQMGQTSQPAASMSAVSGGLSQGEIYMGFSGFKAPSSKYLGMQAIGNAGSVVAFCFVYAN